MIQETPVPLQSLKVGDRATISHFNHVITHDENKLMALGLTPGTPIEISRKAPFSDPLIIKFRGFKLALRKADLKGIWVTTDHEE